MYHSTASPGSHVTTGSRIGGLTAAHRLVGSSPARIRIARTLRRAADRLDTATSPSTVRSALPGGGCSAAAWASAP